VFAATDIVTHSPITNDRIGGDGMTLAELCQAAITTSDNTAGNLILSSLGAPPAVTAYARSLDDPVTRLDRIETALNEATPGDARDTTTPAAMAANLQSLVLGDGLSPRSRDHLTAWLVANKTGGAKLRAGLSKDWRVGDKTGGGGFGTTNDIAVIWPLGRAPLVVCVYLTDTKAPAELRDQTIGAVARAVESTLVA
jgi:beta-lactamase class A